MPTTGGQNKAGRYSWTHTMHSLELLPFLLAMLDQKGGMPLDSDCCVNSAPNSEGQILILEEKMQRKSIKNKFCQK